MLPRIQWSRLGFAQPLSVASPELTLRAIITGLLIGCLLCFTNLYFGLQTGWISMMSLQSALIGFLVSRMFKTPLTPQENVLIQATAAATGTMPLTAGFVGIIPALGLLDEEQDGSPPLRLTWLGAVAWSAAVAYFGVFMSPPVRKQVIIEEQLTFPSGTATAQLISVLHKMPPLDTLHKRKGYTALDSEDAADSELAQEPREGIAAADEEEDEEIKEIVSNEGWSALGWSFFASAALTLFAYFFPITFAIPIFGAYLAKKWLWTFTPSLSYVGQGIIMGFLTTLSMNLGMLVGWGVLSPVSKAYGWAPGAVGDMATGARGWILWTALAIMCSDALISLVPVMMEIVRKMVHGSNPDEDSNENETPDRLVSTKWVLWGLGVSIVVGTIIVWLVFGHEGIKPWATIIGFIMGTLLSILGVRALGETDLNPVSGLGKISQLLFAVIQPGNVVANIIAGGVAEAGAQQAGDLMQDLKTGHLVHASPRAQFYGQLVGSTLSIFVTVTAYTLYARAYPIPGPTFPAPTAYVWLSLARLLRNGELPEKSGEFMLGAAIIFGALSAIKTRLSRNQSRYAYLIPSGVAFAIGFLNTPSFSLARLIGGIVELVYHRHFAQGKHGQDIRLIVVASGFVLGEGVMSVLNLVLRTVGVGVASCWGCGHGMCGGCSA